MSDGPSPLVAAHQTSRWLKAFLIYALVVMLAIVLKIWMVISQHIREQKDRVAL